MQDSSPPGADTCPVVFMKPAADFFIPQDAFAQLFWLVCAVFPQAVVFYVHHVNIRPDGRKPLVPVSILVHLRSGWKHDQNFRHLIIRGNPLGRSPGSCA